MRSALRQMQIVQRNVRGSESGKVNLMPQFSAMRISSGCSSLFFTLTPHDIRSLVTLLLFQDDATFEKRFRLISL